MLPATLEGLFVLLLAIAPGYVAVAFWSRAKTRRAAGSDLIVVLQSLTLSLVIQVLALPLTYIVFNPVRKSLFDYSPFSAALWLRLVVLIVPIIFGSVLNRIEDRFRSRLLWVWPPAPPSAWDSFFTGTIPEGSFVLVEFEDGTRVAGTWEEGSYAVTSPDTHGLFLAREWLVDDDGNFVEVVKRTAGVLVPNDSKIKRIRILK